MDRFGRVNAGLTVGKKYVNRRPAFACGQKSFGARLPGRGVPHAIQYELKRFSRGASSVLGRPAIALKSTSIESQAVTIACLAERGGNHARTIQLAANEMALIAGCDVANQSIPVFEDFWHQQRLDAKEAIGVSVTTTAMPGELEVYGFVLRGTNEHPTYTALNFSDAGMLHSSNTVFAGVPVGQSSLLRRFF